MLATKRCESHCTHHIQLLSSHRTTTCLTSGCSRSSKADSVCDLSTCWPWYQCMCCSCNLAPSVALSPAGAQRASEPSTVLKVFLELSHHTNELFPACNKPGATRGHQRLCGVRSLPHQWNSWRGGGTACPGQVRPSPYRPSLQGRTGALQSQPCSVFTVKQLHHTQLSLNFKLDPLW